MKNLDNRNTNSSTATCKLNGNSFEINDNMCYVKESLLKPITSEEIPEKIMFIFFDTIHTAETIRFRFGVEKISGKLFLRVDECGKISNRIDEEMLKGYYETRKQKIANRQKEIFDVIIDEKIFNQDEFMLRYSMEIEDANEAVLMSEQIYIGVMNSIGNFSY